jgi:hypothetical protein
MRRLMAALAVAALAAAIGAAPAGASFGFKHLDVTFTKADGSPATQAGSHPFEMKAQVDLNTAAGVAEGSVKNLVVDFPAGFVADLKAVPRCSNADFLSFRANGGKPDWGCPDVAAVGTVGASVDGDGPLTDFAPVFLMIPPPGVVAKLGFHILNASVTIKVGVRSEGENNGFATLEDTSQAEAVAGSELTTWGTPADPAHNPLRGGCFQGNGESLGNCPANVTERPFLTLPRSCTGPLRIIFRMTAWQMPDIWVEGEVTTHDASEPPQPLGMTGCSRLGFAPRVSAQPTTDQAESPSGLDFNLDMDPEGLTNPTGIAQSDIKKAVVALPQGVTLNPSAAEGLATCSPQDYAGETVDSEPGQGCPQASKVGTVEVETPLLEGELLKGELFVAQQDDPATAQPGAENPFDSLLALYMVIKDPELGILVKLAGKVEPNEENGPNAGQLVTTFGEPGQEIPQFPFSHFRFHFREGGRSPLITPPHCGTFTTEAVLTPTADPSNPLTVPSSFHIDRGVGGGPCPPGGPPPFAPHFSAGSLNNDAGSYSPFDMRLTRADGEQDMTKFSTVLPPGMIGKIAGISQCPEAAIAAAKTKTGRQELASPSCPANSKIGRTLAGAGVGSQLTYVPGSLYLAGPVAGDPLSVVAITPAVAGPFDAGTVVVRVALTLNPQTAQAEIDGAHSDPIPHILKGIVLKLRDLRVYADRPNFTLNPTNCKPFATKATLFGSFLDVFNPADDVPVSLASPFQAANCASLGFKPKLSMKLEGGTRRGDHPVFKAVATPRPGDANFGGAVVTLPRSAFLDQAHIRTICTRVQYAAKACPAGAVYGQATVWTPLLDEPLTGPVYLRSSNHNLPTWSPPCTASSTSSRSPGSTPTKGASAPASKRSPTPRSRSSSSRCRAAKRA